jgi:hypothetical protein
VSERSAVFDPARLAWPAWATRQRVLLAAGIAAGLLVGVLAGAVTSCEPGAPAGFVAPDTPQAPASPKPPTEATAPPTGSPATVAPPVSDGCHGLVSTSQVTKATGLALAPGGGDQAAAAVQYTRALESLGLRASVRLCAFANPRGDQLYAMALSFPDVAQAIQMFAEGRGASSIRDPEPVPGLWDAAVTDRSHTLLVRRRTGVLLVYLVVAGSPDADHLGALRTVATAALGRL